MGVSQMKIGWVDVLKERYGGTIYTDMAQSVLSKHYDLERINVGLDHFKKCHYPKILYRLYQSFRSKRDLDKELRFDPHLAL